MDTDLGRACVKDLVEFLGKAHVSHVVSAVYNCHIFIGIYFRDDLLHKLRTVLRLGACLDHRRVSAGDGSNQNPEGQYEGEVEGAYDERYAVWNFVDLGGDTWKAVKATKMRLRPGPRAKAFHGLVDLEDEASDVAEVCFHRGSSKISVQNILKDLLILDNCCLKSSQLSEPEFDIQGSPGIKEFTLLINYLSDRSFSVHSILHVSLQQCLRINCNKKGEYLNSPFNGLLLYSILCKMIKYIILY